jgi:hypothetical protein
MVGMLSILFLILGGLILLPLCAGAAGLGSGALSHAAAAVFENQAITIRGAYRAAWKRGWRYIWLLVLEGLIIVAAPAVLWIALIVVFAIAQGARGSSAAQTGVLVTGVMVLFLAAMGMYALWMLLALCLSFPACVVENAGAWTAVKRAVVLSQGTRGRILVLYILGMLLRWGCSLVLAIPAILIVTLVPGLDAPQHAQVIGSVMAVVIYGGSYLVRGITKPIYSIAQMGFYYDQRIRKEGFDIELLMRRAGMAPIPAAVAEAVPWMAPVHVKDIAPPLLAEQAAIPGGGAGNGPEMALWAGVKAAAGEPVQLAREENAPSLRPLPGENA